MVSFTDSVTIKFRSYTVELFYYYLPGVFFSKCFSLTIFIVEEIQDGHHALIDCQNLATRVGLGMRLLMRMLSINGVWSCSAYANKHLYRYAVSNISRCQRASQLAWFFHRYQIQAQKGFIIFERSQVQSY